MIGCERLECRAYSSAPPATVVARSVYYNGSALDGNDPTINADDDAAVAPDKAALLPGQAASAGNVTSFTRGITGFSVDLRSGTPFVGAADFTFRTGNSADPSTWGAAPPPTAVVVRLGAGTGGSDRVSVTFADGAIRNEWLEVTLGATFNTRLAAPDVFYLGNLAGDAGGDDLTVGAGDLIATRSALATGRADAASPFDHNRDGLVDARDLAAVRQNLGRSLVRLGASPAVEAVPIATNPIQITPEAPQTTRRRSAYVIY